jgi:2-polyprenyl-3-methyl-5-hydroxy-6-metoxy-1,4-benzoquinol methylase
MTTLTTSTNKGLHEFLLETVLPPLTERGARAIDLGGGSGALSIQLQQIGLDVVAADKNREGFKADVPFFTVDFDKADFSKQLGEGSFSLVTAVEVIEHVESPIGFLRNAGRLLRPGGALVITTPNVDSAPARVKFLLTEKIRMMDEHSEPTHISPIFWDLLNRQFLPRAGLKLQRHFVYPNDGFQVTRRRYSWFFRSLSLILAGECLIGDNHIFVLKPV